MSRDQPLTSDCLLCSCCVLCRRVHAVRGPLLQPPPRRCRTRRCPCGSIGTSSWMQYCAILCWSSWYGPKSTLPFWPCRIPPRLLSAPGSLPFPERTVDPPCLFQCMRRNQTRTLVRNKGETGSGKTVGRQGVISPAFCVRGQQQHTGVDLSRIIHGRADANTAVYPQLRTAEMPPYSGHPTKASFPASCSSLVMP